MNYDKIILELLDRIKNLEDRVNDLESGPYADTMKIVEDEGWVYNPSGAASRKVSLTQKARDYIAKRKEQAKAEGSNELELLCNDIQIALGVTNRTPCICTAMYDCMKKGDVIVSAPPSGKSTTVRVKYYL